MVFLFIFRLFETKKMESELSNFGFSAVNSEQDFIDFLVSYFDWLENFDDYLKILSFYHVEKGKHDN